MSGDTTRGGRTSRVFSVAWRDFKQTALTKAFIFAIVGVPILMIGVSAVAVVIMATNKSPALVGTVAVVDPDGALAAAMQEGFDAAADEKPLAAAMSGDAAKAAEQFAASSPASALQRGEVRLEVERVDPGADAPGDLPAAVRERVLSGDLIAAVAVPPVLLEMPQPRSDEADGADDDHTDEARLDVLVPENTHGEHISLIERAAGEAVVTVRMDRAGINPDDMRRALRRPRAATERLDESGHSREDDRMQRELKGTLIPMAFMMLIWASTFTSGQQLLMSTIEEKSNKVMEVLLSAVSPMELMTGKILGQGLVGLIIMAVYSSLGLSALIFFALSSLVTPVQIALFVVYFFMAYFMIASLMAAVGSAVSDIREANQLMTPVMIVLIIPLMLWMPISQAPNGAIATIASFIPPATPFVMAVRTSAEEAVPLWQIPATILWGGVCTVAMVWLAARIFRVGVLMQGKPPSPLELLKWVRYA